MIKVNKKYIVFIVFFSFFILALAFLIPYIKVEILRKNCTKIYADRILKLPDKKDGLGFTCTGLFYDKEENCFLVGNAGKYKPNDKQFKATIEVVEKDFSSITSSIPCYLNFEKMKDIQGVCKASDGTIWLCSYGENKIRHINENGQEIGYIDMLEPSGIANDSRSNTLWVLTKKYLYNCTYDGKVKRKIKLKIKGQDQIFLDEENNLIYLSVGSNYSKESYIYMVDLETNEIKPVYELQDSYAIEGIAIVDDVLYVLNDGYYHDAKVAVNQVNMYDLKNTKDDNE